MKLKTISQRLANLPSDKRPLQDEPFKKKFYNLVARIRRQLTEGFIASCAQDVQQLGEKYHFASPVVHARDDMVFFTERDVLSFGTHTPDGPPPFHLTLSTPALLENVKLFVQAGLRPPFRLFQPKCTWVRRTKNSLSQC